MKQKILIIVLSVFIAGSLGFIAGKVSAKQLGFKNQSYGDQAGGTQFMMGQRQGGSMMGRTAFGGFTSGEIISKDDKSITIKMNTPISGNNQESTSSKIVFFGETTQIEKSVSGSLSDLSVGENVLVTGSRNSDGSIVAQSIQLRPKQTK